jgi:hypothetical protein
MLEDVGLSEDERAEFQKHREMGSNSNPEFTGLGALQKLKEAAQFIPWAHDVLTWIAKKRIGGAVADSISGSHPPKPRNAQGA